MLEKNLTKTWVLIFADLKIKFVNWNQSVNQKRKENSNHFFNAFTFDYTKLLVNNSLVMVLSKVNTIQEERSTKRKNIKSYGVHTLDHLWCVQERALRGFMNPAHRTSATHTITV